MRLSFIQLSGFAKNWNRLDLGDQDLRALESVIQGAPDAAPVMSGTGGLRKIRLAPDSSASGKSGGIRVCYAHFPEFGLVYLCAVFPKSDKANLTQAERNAWRTALGHLHQHLKESWQKGRTP